MRKLTIKTLQVVLLLSGIVLAASCNNSSGRKILECGGTAQFRCPAGMYCNLNEGCGGVDAEGTCRRQPTDCPDNDEPICGCDGKTYSNACYANGSGITVDYQGPCIK